MSTRRERIRRRRGNRAARLLLLFLAASVTVAVLAGAGAVGWVVSVAASAPAIDTLEPADQGENSVILAADGTRLGVIESDVRRRPVPSTSIPDNVRNATVAIEDRRFYQHEGVDFEGVVRAALRNIESGETVEGGSTLTMQLVRTLYISNERTFERKIREAKLAEELENAHPGPEGKRWILTKYLNSVPYGTVNGQTAVGIDAAARTFFDTRAADLKLHEAALLAGLPQAPSAYNPFLDPERAKARRDDVLDRMAEQGMIQQRTAERAKRRPLGVERGRYYTQRRESFFFDYVRKELIDRYGVERVRRGGLRVQTTIDLDMQRAAREAISDTLDFANPPKAAVVTVSPRDGAIRAMASSASYSELKFNLAAQGKRQAGSTFKIMGLMAALDAGVDPRSVTYTSKRLKFEHPRYGPIDVDCYSGCTGRSMDLVRATLASDNSVYQQLALDIGPEKVKEAAVAMGIPRDAVKGYPGEILGGLERGVSPLEMANAYATIASGGWRNRPKAITKVTFADGEVDDLSRPRRHKAFSDAVTSQVTRILEQNIQSGTGQAAQIGCPAAGKTGTVDEFVDAWFAGFTPNLSTAVWVGYPEDTRVQMVPPTTPREVAGGTYPAEIWGAYMREARRGCDDFRAPREGFVAQPFGGDYAQGRGPGLGATPDAPSDGLGVPDEAPSQPSAPTAPTGTGTPGPDIADDEPTPTPEPEPDTGGGGGGGGDTGGGEPSGGAAPDPEDYTSTP
jgi:penicillin-binding protein 1A